MRLLWLLLTIISTSVWSLDHRPGMDTLLKRQDASGGFIAPIETSTILYNAQMVYLYRYLNLTTQKASRVNKLIGEIKSQHTQGFSIYDEGEEQLSLVKSAFLAYHLSGLNKNDSYYQDAQSKLSTHSKAGDDFFNTPYLMLFGLNQQNKCVAPGTWNWVLKRDHKLPWIRVLAYPILFMILSDGTHATQNWPLEIPKTICPGFKVKPEAKKEMALGYLNWFKSIVADDGTIFDYAPTTIPNVMALAHAKTILPEKAAEIQRLIDHSLKTLEEFQIPTSSGLKQSAGEGSITETVEMINLMMEAGIKDTDSRFKKAMNFLLTRQHANGGWGFSAYNKHFPDPDGTGLVLSMLNSYQKRHPRKDVELASIKAAQWLATRNNPDGGFASWDRKQDMLWWMGILTKPLAKRGLVLSESVEEATSRVLIGMAKHKSHDPKIHLSWKKAMKWLLKRQAQDGSFPGTWMIGSQFGTASALSALSTGLGDSTINQKKLKAAIEKGTEYLITLQRPDGSFGDHPRTYETGKPEVLSVSSPAFTGIIVSRIVQFDQLSHHQYSSFLAPVIKRSADFISQQMNQNGLWDDQTWTAVTFPKIEYARYSFIQQLESLRVLIYARESSGIQ